jgi:hypothetical protein
MTTAGHIGGAVQMASTGSAVASSPAVRTDGSYTAMAFVKLDTMVAGAAPVALSQSGTHTSGFVLQYRGNGHWGMSIAPTDIDTPAWIVAESTSTANLHEWTHLTGVYDAGAHEMRLYVNGALEKTTPIPASTAITNVVGNLVIGRSQSVGVPSRFWPGAVDEVHVYAGVLADRAIAAASGQTAPSAPSAYAGQFSRFVGHDGRHFVGTGPVPPGYYFERAMGLPAPAGAPNTRMIYSCRKNGNWYLDAAVPCTNDGELLGPAGLMYTSEPTDVPTREVYRCLVAATGDHFLSFDDKCEGMTLEFPLGWTRALGNLVRYSQSDGAHWTSLDAYRLPASYTQSETLGMVSILDVPGTVELSACLSGTDEFLSLDVTCGGAQYVSTAGRIWPDPPDDVQRSDQLFACQSTGGERFESLDRFCEGAPTSGQPLGYVITAP